MGGLSEYASQLDFACMGGLTVGFAFAAFGFFLHHRHTGPVHLHVQNGNRLAGQDREVQLDGLTDFALLARGDVGANRLRRTLHRFGRHFQSCQNLHLLTTVIEGDLLADYGLHATHAGRKVRVLHVQLLIGGKLSFMAALAQVPRTVHTHPAHHGKHWPGAQFLILRPMTTGTRQLKLIRHRRFELQQFRQGAGSGLMEREPQGALDGLQIGAAAVSSLAENADQQLIYFPRDLLMDCSSRFFP
jgi:hypothetical protein